MNIIEKLKKDQLFARKDKNKIVASILTTLIGEIVSVGKNNGNRDTTEDEAIKVIEKFKKNAEQTCSLMSDSGADSKEIEDYVEEISIYDSYLPKKMTTTELTSLIQDIISHDSDINMGKIMKFLKSQYANKYDGKEASSIAKKLLI